MNKVLILGGYGNFGARISSSLAKAGIPIIISGRDRHQADNLQTKIKIAHPESHIEIAIFDVKKEFATHLKQLHPAIVINTVGPFQSDNYITAETCIAHKIHYIDLADARDFVCGISSLTTKAKENDVLVVSGASTVPGLSSAVLDHFKNEFSEIISVEYGISPGQKTPRGLATVKSILSYLGKPIKPYLKTDKPMYGWQDLHREEYPDVGKRWMSNCDIPDLDLFPKKYHIQSLRFSAGMESSVVHIGMWLVSWLIRMGLPINLANHAEPLLKLSNVFNFLGTEDGGMHMYITGIDKEKKPKKIKWYIIAIDGDGPQIPCVPSIILTKKILAGAIPERGAMPCVSMITLEEYLSELQGFAVKEFII